MSAYRFIRLLSLTLFSLVEGASHLSAQVFYLPEVEVRKPYVVQRGDTTSYIVDLMKRKSDRTVEDLLQMIPGIEIDSRGHIFYRGKGISHFYIEGMDLLGDDYTLATRHIRPEDVQIIQILDNHQPIKALKDLAFSDRGAINLKLKKESMLRPIGYALAGMGHSDDVTAKGLLHTLQVKPGMQQLGHLSYNHNTYTHNPEKSYTQPSHYLPSFLDQSLFKEELFDIDDSNLERYAHRRRMTGNYNFLKKRDNGYLCKFTAAYEHNRMAYALDRENRYMLSPDSYLSRAESNRTMRRTGSLKVGVDVENNQDHLYIKHHTDCLWERANNDYTIGSNLFPTTKERVYGDYINLQSATTAIVRKGDRTYNTRIWAAYVHRPNSRLELSQPELPDTSLVQQYAGEAWVVRGYTGWSYSFNASFHIGVNIDLLGRYDSFRSDLSENGNAPSYHNNYRSRSAQVTLRPYAAYRGETWNWRVEIPFAEQYLQVGKERECDVCSKTIPDVGLKVTSSVRLSPLWSVDASAGEERRLGDIRQFIMNPIYIAYNTRAASGSGILSDEENRYVNGMLMYRNQLDGWFATLSGETKHASTNLSRSTHIGETQDEATITAGHFKQERNILTLSISKSCFDQALVVKGNASLHWIENDIYRQNIAYRMCSLMENYRLSVQKSFFDQRLSLSVSGGYNCGSYEFKTYEKGQPEGGNREALWSNDNKVTFCPLDGLTLSLTSQHLWRTGYEERYDFFLDASALWKKGKYEVELSLYNLADRKTWQSYHADGTDSRLMIYHPRPLECLLTVKYLF